LSSKRDNGAGGKTSPYPALGARTGTVELLLTHNLGIDTVRENRLMVQVCPS
jgi:hypothetical protein